jgi:hypothetical protein
VLISPSPVLGYLDTWHEQRVAQYAWHSFGDVSLFAMPTFVQPRRLQDLIDVVNQCLFAPQKLHVAVEAAR